MPDGSLGSLSEQDVFHRRLAAFNEHRFAPGLPHAAWEAEIEDHAQLLLEEGPLDRGVPGLGRRTRSRGAADAGRFHRLVRGSRAHGSRAERSAVPLARRGGDDGGDALVPDAGSGGRGRVRGSDGDHPGEAAGPAEARAGAQLLGRDGSGQSEGDAWPDARESGGLAEADSEPRDDGVGVARAGQHDGGAWPATGATRSIRSARWA